MSGGAQVWLTDNELQLMTEWYWMTVLAETNTLEDDKLKEKLDYYREEVVCRVRV